MGDEGMTSLILRPEQPATSSTLAVGSVMLSGEGSLGASSVSTLLGGLVRPAWADAAARVILMGLARNEVPVDAAAKALRWLRDLPPSMPAPHTTVSSDATISVEWDRRGNVLHAMFGADFAEIYFAGSNGDEWETDLGSGQDKVDLAIRTLARSE